MGPHLAGGVKEGAQGGEGAGGRAMQLRVLLRCLLLRQKLEVPLIDQVLPANQVMLAQHHVRLPTHGNGQKERQGLVFG